MGLTSIFGGSGPSSGTRAAKDRKDGDKTAAPAPASGAACLPPSPVTESSSAPGFIVDEEQLASGEDAPPDLRELNASLEALAVVFPDIQIQVFREMLNSFDGESRLAVVADALLKNRVAWVKGRWKAMDEGAGPTQVTVPASETFRTPEYKRAVQALAWHEFRGLPRSTIDAVLAESNYTYLEARETLVALSSKSWRFAITSLFWRRTKPVTSTEAATHPLVVWRPIGQGSTAVPSIRPTGNAQLDRELFTALIAPLRRQVRADQMAADRALAHEINSAEAEEAEGLFECVCCFTESAFEQFAPCGTEGHLICLECVYRSLSEAVFGQGWQRSIDTATGTLRCPAATASRGECPGTVSTYHMHRACLEHQGGADMMRRLDQRLAEHSLATCGLPLIRCPFCPYAEVDDVYVPANKNRMQLRTKNVYSLMLLLLCACAIPFVLSLVILSSSVALLLHSRYNLVGWIQVQLHDAFARRQRRHRGLRFQCRRPDCWRQSCLSCGKKWVDVHVCHESSLVALRTQVEQAMSMAVKRVCPRCNTSFVKTAGCNKLTCPCGYKMCYICRKDISGSGDGADIGYRHFCEHFRPEGDGRKCRQCDKCNLWQTEDEEAVLRKAKEEAERKWYAAEKRELSRTERAFLETGVATTSPRKGRGGLVAFEWTVAGVFDVIVEHLFV